MNFLESLMRLPFLCLLLTVGACATDDDPAPSQLSFDGKADGFSIANKAFLPLEHGETLTIPYTDDAGKPADFVYAGFSLSGHATASFSTQGADTELYVYKQLDSTWWVQLAKHHGTLTIDLDQGPYRLLLRQRTPATMPTSIDLTTSCTGDGCTVYTAFPIDAPQLVNKTGAPLLTEPRLTAVTFDGDEFRSDLETYIGTIGSSDYWHATVSEYGVAPAMVGAPVHLSEAAPASLTRDEVRAWLAAKLDGTHPEFGTPDAHSFYVLYFPDTTLLDLDGEKGCTGFGGYHDAATLPNGVVVLFAAMPRCATFGPLQGLDVLTGATSHELVEGVTDPQPSTMASYQDPDMEHISWSIETGGEAGDMCAAVPGAFTKVPGFPYLVQRTWSNAAAKAGHDPCVPHVSTDPYVVAVPVLDELAGDGKSTLGIQLAAGQSRTIEVDVSSDGPTDQPITLSAFDGNKFTHNPQNLDFTWDRTTASNGDRVHLTVHAQQADPRGFATLIITAKTSETNASLWHGMVGF
jgi:hypothetical protein